jgi:Ca2+-binding RTX toxin-like protein
MKRRALLLMATMAAALLVASGVAIAERVICDSTPPCYGTPEDDVIDGDLGPETIYAYGGDDEVYADGVKNNPISGGGNDTVYGSSGNDDLSGEGGSDKVYGGGGRDLISASYNDTTGSTDHSYGGGGNDTIDTVDDKVDIIDCGKGTRDFVQYDADLDTVKGCEVKSPL